MMGGRMNGEKRPREPERDKMRFLYKRFATIGENAGKDLKTRLKGEPVAIRCAGLAVVVAQRAASTNSEDRIIGSLLAEWLLVHARVFADENRGDELRDLLEQCVKSSRLEYEAAQREALQLMEQAKLLAAALWP